MASKKDKDTERAFQQVLKIVEDTNSVEQEFKRLEVNIMNIMCCVQVLYQGGRSCTGAQVAPAEKFGLGRKF